MCKTGCVYTGHCIYMRGTNELCVEELGVCVYRSGVWVCLWVRAVCENMYMYRCEVYEVYEYVCVYLCAGMGV